MLPPPLSAKNTSKERDFQSDGTPSECQPKKAFQRPADHTLGGTKAWGFGDNPNNKGGGGNDWNAPWGNGEKKQSPSGPHAPPDFKAPSAANGKPGNGGDNPWGGNNRSAAWNTQDNGWGAQKDSWPGPGGIVSKKNTPRQHSSFHGAQENAWGGPPGSKPSSNRGSRAGSNSGWHDNKNGNFDGNGGLSHRNSPQYKGAFDWSVGQGPPTGMNNGGYSNSAWGHHHGSRANSQSGDQKGGPSQSNWQDASNQATGPSQTDSWMNPHIAQHTGGKADQW